MIIVERPKCWLLSSQKTLTEHTYCGAIVTVIVRTLKLGFHGIDLLQELSRCVTFQCMKLVQSMKELTLFGYLLEGPDTRTLYSGSLDFFLETVPAHKRDSTVFATKFGETIMDTRIKRVITQ